MREASGSVVSSDPLVALFYLLGRDLSPLGKLESLLDEAVGEREMIFTNGWLADWAIDAAGRIRGEIK